ncbi:hypothetical protein ACPYO6_15065 [Georgenia sp. Z1344]|uniref:hypothetical protein n=1 Tax=Georgenia sp. Z1344 TaxID=3416706 RepID=UPI003CE97804
MTTTSPRRRWRQPVLGVLAGAAAALIAFLLIGLIRGDHPEELTTGYSLSDEDAFAPGPVSLVSVWDVRQPSSIPGLAAPTGDRYLTLDVALDSNEGTADDWLDLEGLELGLFAVDDSGEREELVPTDSSRATLDSIGGTIRAIDPYWIDLTYEPPSGDAAHYEVDLTVGGEEYTLAAHPGEDA